MPHNPRRERVVESPDTGLSAERIAAALERAAALRRGTARDPDGVRTVAMSPGEGHAATTNWRRHTHPYRMTHADRSRREPWCLIGWVGMEHAWGFVDGVGRDRYNQTWEVWLNTDDDRVWLKLHRQGRGSRDDPYP